MCIATGARAQGLSVADTTISDSRELVSNKDWHFIGRVEMKRPPDTTIYADDVRVSTDNNHAIATGNVVFSQGNNWIAAERAEFDTATSLGTFYIATGNANIQPPRNARPGAGAPPPVAGQETDVYFYGDMVEKLGPRKYRITNGGFTTCVQPTPRWQLTSSTVVLNIDHYTMLRNAVLNVKGVPMFYTPILYYPTKREDRSTGILIPTYGTSTLYGQAIHNAFFWAINRSQDATFMHDWYTSAGQGVGGEYRYNYGNGTDGNFNVHWLDQKETDVHARRRIDQLAAGAAQLRDSRRRQPGHLAALSRAHEHQLLLEHRVESDAQHEHLRRVAQPAQLRRQRHRPVEGILDQRHAGPQRVPHPGRDRGHHRLDADGQLAAGERHAQRDAAARLRVLLFTGRGIRLSAALEHVRRRWRPIRASAATTSTRKSAIPSRSGRGSR